MKARPAVNAQARDFNAIDLFRRTVVRTAMGKHNDEKTLIHTHQVRALVKNIIAAHTRNAGQSLWLS